MLPSVLLPWSSYSAASGNSPMPTLSRTMTIARENTASFGPAPGGARRPADVSSRMMRREIVRNAAWRANRGDGVLENQVIHARMLHDQREPIEVLDAGFE